MLYCCLWTLNNNTINTNMDMINHIYYMQFNKLHNILSLWITDVVRERELDGCSTIRSDEFESPLQSALHRNNLVY